MFKLMLMTLVAALYVHPANAEGDAEIWGSSNAQLTIVEGIAVLNQRCSSLEVSGWGKGESVGVLKINRNGEITSSQEVQVSAKVEGDLMIVTIDDGKSVQSLELQKGLQAKLEPCN